MCGPKTRRGSYLDQRLFVCLLLRSTKRHIGIKGSLSLSWDLFLVSRAGFVSEVDLLCIYGHCLTNQRMRPKPIRPQRPNPISHDDTYSPVICSIKFSRSPTAIYMAEPQGQNNSTQGVDLSAETVTSGTMTPAIGSGQTVACAVNTTSSGSTQQSTNSTTPNRKTHPTDEDEWLTSIYINAEWSLPMKVAEFSKVKSASDPGDSFWRDCHISWALKFI